MHHKRKVINLIYLSTLFLLLFIAPGIAVATTNLDSCMNDIYNEFGLGGDINCVANDIVPSLASFSVSDGCDSPLDTATIDLDIEVTLNAGARHDIGI